MTDLPLPLAVPDSTATWAALCGGVLIIVYTMLKKRGRKDPLDHAPSSSTLSQQRSVERQMSNLLVEMSEMARQVSAQLDTRSTKLELLIKDADERIAELR